MHRARAGSRFFEDLGLDSMSGNDGDSNYQAQTVDISEDSKTNAFEQTEIVDNVIDNQ